MKLADTVDMMNSDDFKERFRAEYFQLSNRIESLSNMLTKYRESLSNMLIKYRAGTLDFTPKYTIKLLDAQMNAMIIYRTHLEERAKIEGISLDESVKEVVDDKKENVPDDKITVSGK